VLFKNFNIYYSNKNEAEVGYHFSLIGHDFKSHLKFLIFDSNINDKQNRLSIETDLENYIQYAIKDINNINVRIKYFNDQKVIFAIKFSADTYLKNQLMECTIEVPLQ
jgi:hypothetical protein